LTGNSSSVPVRRGVGDLDSLYTLNPIGCLLWDFMAEGHTLKKKAGHLTGLFC